MTWPWPWEAGALAKPWRLTAPGKAFTLGQTTDFDSVAGGEDLDTDGVADSQILAFDCSSLKLTNPAEIAQTLEVALERLGKVFLLAGAELNGRITVLFDVFDLGDDVRSGLKQGYRYKGALFVIDLGHAHFGRDYEFGWVFGHEINVTQNRLSPSDCDSALFDPVFTGPNQQKNQAQLVISKASCEGIHQRTCRMVGRCPMVSNAILTALLSPPPQRRWKDCSARTV